MPYMQVLNLNNIHVLWDVRGQDAHMAYLQITEVLNCSKSENAKIAICVTINSNNLNANLIISDDYILARVHINQINVI